MKKLMAELSAFIKCKNLYDSDKHCGSMQLSLYDNALCRWKRRYGGIAVF